MTFVDMARGRSVPVGEVVRIGGNGPNAGRVGVVIRAGRHPIVRFEEGWNRILKFGAPFIQVLATSKAAIPVKKRVTK